MNAVGFYVVGLPAPQGSKRHLGNGVMAESSAKVKPWREAVKWAALPHRPVVPLDGPLLLHVTFTLPRPRSAVRARVMPDRYPDLSKLVRSTEDALTDVGVWADDARVVRCEAAKVWWGHDAAALPVPGCVLAVGPTPGDRWVRAAFDAALTDALNTLTGRPSSTSRRRSGTR